MPHCKQFSWSCPASLAGLLLAGCPQGDFEYTGQPEPGASDESSAAPTSTPTSGQAPDASSTGDPADTTPPVQGDTTSAGGASTSAGPEDPATSANPEDSSGQNSEDSSGQNPEDPSTSTNPDDSTTGAVDPSNGDTTTGESTGAVDPSNGDTSTSESTGAPADDTTGAPEPPPKFVISVLVDGLIADEAEADLNDIEALALAEPGEFAFATELAEGEPYAISLKDQPAHYTCVVEQGAGVMPAHDVVVPVTCTPKPSTTLVISEVGYGYFINESRWFEILNISAQAQSLAGITLRTRGILVDANYNVTDKGVLEFPLPAVQLAPGGRLVLRGDLEGETAAGPGLALLALPGGEIPTWRTDFGALELRKAGASVDYVAWGNIPFNQVGALEPQHPSAWPGYPAGLPVPPPVEVASRGRGLARALVAADTNATADLTVVEYSTPGGPNDTHGCVLDGDVDGLPDCSEAAGKTYAGVDLYAYGARPNQRDIFVEVDAMDPKGGDGVTLDPGMIPSKVALDRIAAKFKDNGFTLHFDVGDLFDKAPGIDPQNHDLGGGSALPFTDRVSFDPDPGSAWMVQLKADYFALPRLKSFHYAVYGNRTYNGGLGGQGERPGNDLYVSFGAHTFNTDTSTDTNILINNQTQTLMHELGHNLGLSHGGYSTANGDAKVDEANWKPNYVSVMNYLYNTGLQLGTVGDRYYYEHEDENAACKAKNVDFCTMSASMCGDPGQFRIDYSHGKGSDIDTKAVVETQGLRQPGSVGVDFDCDGVTEGQPYASTLYAAVDGMNLPLTLLRDHDDWGGLDLFFARTWAGAMNSPVYGPAARDIQPRAAVDELSPALLAWLRRR